MRPDRVVIGCQNKKTEDIMKELYRPLYLLETPIVSTTVESAEIIKYASNSFLATKISFINQVADLCEKVGADVQDVAKGMGIDKRIGDKFLHAGPGYGGSCFPKDVKALQKAGREQSYDFKILNSVIEVNEKQKIILLPKIEKHFNNELSDIKLAIWGLAFKPETDDIREAPSIYLMRELLKKGAKLSVYDPEAIPNIENIKIVPKLV